MFEPALSVSSGGGCGVINMDLLSLEAFDDVVIAAAGYFIGIAVITQPHFWRGDRCAASDFR